MTAPIWFGPRPTDMPHFDRPGLVRQLGIELTDAGDDWLSGRMPVDDRTLQPFGLLHGGASVALAETLASVGAFACVDPKAKLCVGLEINANHLLGVRSGWVSGTAQPVHIGRSTQVWNIRIVDEDGKPICVSRCTLAVVNKPRTARTPESRP